MHHNETSYLTYYNRHFCIDIPLAVSSLTAVVMFALGYAMKFMVKMCLYLN